MLSSLIAPITNLIGEFVEDKDQTARLAHKITTLAQQQAHAEVIAQVEVNKAEAKHRSLLVAGWRPMIGWVCGAAFAWHFVLAPVLILVLSYLGQPIPALPAFDMASLMTVLMGMLGLGGLRTFEKTKKVN